MNDVLGTTIVACDGDECGAIPLDAVAPPRPLHYRAYAGAAAGAIRASSGFSFVRTQRHAAALANAICRGTRFPVPGQVRYRLLDAALLTLLRGGAIEAPRFFTALFERSDANAVARFLADSSTPVDDVRMLAGLLRRAA